VEGAGAEAIGAAATSGVAATAGTGKTTPLAEGCLLSNAGLNFSSAARRFSSAMAAARDALRPG